MANECVSTLIAQYGDVLSRFFDHISDMVFLMQVEPEGEFRYVLMNPSAMKCAGIDASAYGRLLSDVFPNEKGSELIKQYQRAVRAGEPVSFELGGAESTLTPMFNQDGVCTHVFSVTRDISERMRLEEQLQFLAYHDALTNLPNRRLFQDRLTKAMAQAKRNKQGLALLYLDCDKLKQLNDTYGHDAGDEFLQIFSERLRGCVRDMDTVARLGGDEFVVLLAAIHSQEEAAKIAQRFLDVLQEKYVIGGVAYQITVSIGIALYPQDGVEIEDLLRNADDALYRAKKAGKNRFQFYEK